MKKQLLHLTLCIAILLSGFKSNAQSTLIHYWHFNYTPTGVNLYNLNANYSVIDTTKANIMYMPVAGVVADTGYMDNVTGDTLNARMGVIAGNGVRSRNPSDSMELRFYIPVTGYKNIKIKWEDEISSTKSGQLEQVFDYSLDSGMIWQTSALSRTSDSALETWSLDSVQFDNTVFNTNQLVFRIRYMGNTTGTKGNTRYDNVTVEGDTFIASSSSSLIANGLIHYWNFNNFSGTYNNPGIPSVKADWSAIDTNLAQIAYVLEPGASSNYLGYIDDVTGDTTNARMGAVAGNGYRFRNPSDSAYMVLYIPTTGYKNIVLKYASQTSSLTSGMLQQQFSYSTDSGMTWKTTGLNMTSDSTTTDWSLVSVNFGTDTSVNNNPALAFRIKFAGNTTSTKGNNRFDNITVEADSMAYLPSAVNNIINTTPVCTLYPNPATNSISINTTGKGAKTVTIYNVTGQRVFAQQYFNDQFNINISGFNAGIYFAHVQMSNGQSATMQFVKK